MLSFNLQSHARQEGTWTTTTTTTTSTHSSNVLCGLATIRVVVSTTLLTPRRQTGRHCFFVACHRPEPATTGDSFCPASSLAARAIDADAFCSTTRGSPATSAVLVVASCNNISTINIDAKIIRQCYNTQDNGVFLF